MFRHARLIPIVLLTFTISALTGVATGSDDDMPTYFLDWDAIDSGEGPSQIQLAPSNEGTCTARIRSEIAFSPTEFGVKRIVAEPAGGTECLYNVYAKRSSDSEGLAMRESMRLTDAVGVIACQLGPTCGHEVPNAPPPSTGPAGGDPLDVNAKWCRAADGWAHTGFPDPPTVVYTRVYQDVKFCWDADDAWLEEIGGVCFANPGSDWYTDSDECYFSDYETGPAPTAYLTIHGFFEKASGAPPFRPTHDMWNTVHGESGTGRVYCTGDIIGDYDGYVTVDNCGAGEPESS